MRIHLYQQFFSGPAAPGPHQPRWLVRRLGERGHDVHVVAGDYNVYNEQDEPEEETRFPAGNVVRVHRARVPRGLRRSLRSRLTAYLGYARAARAISRTLPAPSVVLGSIQPMFTGLVASRVAREAGVPFILEVRDLWPDALVVKGALSKWQAAPLHAIVSHLYRGADRIVSLTPGIRDELVRKGIPATRIDVFTNGFDPDLHRLSPGSRERVRGEMGWKDDFVAIYTGTHVEVTAVDVIVRAAQALRARKDIRFELFGSGQRKAAVIDEARSLGLDNISFHDPVPKAKVPELLSAADVGLMTLFRSPLVHIYFENKLIDYMGAGLPIAAAMEGPQAVFVERERVGRAVAAFDHAGLAALVAAAKDDRADWAAMGERGRALAMSAFSLPDLSDRYAAMAEDVANGRGRSRTPYFPGGVDGCLR